MADAHAQLTNSIGVCLVAAAPGAANAVGPLFSARQSESPVLFLTGDSPSSHDGFGAFQELDLVSITTPMTKLSFRSQTADNIGTDMLRAICTALSGRPGPVHVAVPFNLLNDNLAPDTCLVPEENLFSREVNAVASSTAQDILRLVNAADKPLVLVGPVLNPTRSVHELSHLENHLNAPIVVMESPRGLKDPSLGAVAEAVAQSDLILCLGKIVNFTLGFGSSKIFSSNTRWIVVDSDCAELNKAKANLTNKLIKNVHADPRDLVVSLLNEDSVSATDIGWREEVSYLIRRRSESKIESNGDGITSESLCVTVEALVRKQLKSIVISDGGEFGQWSQACTSGHKRLINGPSGAIGGAVCYALAAKLVHPASTVFALMGDGTVGFHLAEFETAAREGIPFVSIIGNDLRWNAEHQIQVRDYGVDRLIACQLSDARYDLAVEALGGHGEYVTCLSELPAALERAVASAKVACVNVMIKGLPAPELI